MKSKNIEHPMERDIYTGMMYTVINTPGIYFNLVSMFKGIEENLIFNEDNYILAKYYIVFTQELLCVDHKSWQDSLTFACLLKKFIVFFVHTRRFFVHIFLYENWFFFRMVAFHYM